MKFKSLGKKLTSIICIMLAVSILVVILASLGLAKNHSDSIMQEKSVAGLALLKNELNDQIERLRNTFSYLESSGIAGEMLMNGSTEIMAPTWEIHKGTENDFAAFAKKDGTIVWQTENFILSDHDVSKGLDGMITSGIVVDTAAGLTLQYLTPISMYNTIVGTAVVGMYLTESSYLDELTALTGAEVTLFRGTTRYATTVMNADGTRAIGTEMSAKVAQKVIDQGLPYAGTADILGQNHYVDYEPMFDINGNIVGAFFAGYSSA